MKDCPEPCCGSKAEYGTSCHQLLHRLLDWVKLLISHGSHRYLMLQRASLACSSLCLSCSH